MIELVKILAYISIGLWIPLGIQWFKFDDDPEYIVTSDHVYKCWGVNFLSGILLASLICNQFVDNNWTLVIISVFVGFWWFILSTFVEMMIGVWLEDVDLEEDDNT